MSLHTYTKAGVKVAESRYNCRWMKYCGNGSCIASEIIDEVKKALHNALDDFEVHADTGEDDSIEIHRQLVERLERRLVDLEAQELSQWDKYTQEGMPKHIFEQLNKKVLAEKEEVQQAIYQAKSTIPEPVDFQKKAATFHEVLNMLDDPEAPIKELNALLKECIEVIIYRRPKPKKQGVINDVPFELDIKLRV